MGRQEAVPPNMHHVTNGGRRWRGVDRNVRIHSIVGLQSGPHGFQVIANSGTT